MSAETASKIEALSTNDPASPPGWGNDEMTKFFDAARDNQHATYFRKTITKTLVAIDAQFFRVSKDWLNPQSEILALMFLRCHSAFRAASSLAMAGQACEAMVVSRSMLEFAAYAVHIHRDPALEVVWLDRHTDDASFKKQRGAFHQVNIAKSVRAANRHAGDRFEMLYQRTIDFGGHPNERSVTSNMQMKREVGRREMLSIMLHGDTSALGHGLKTVAQCGVNTLEMLQIPFNARFELLGISAAILKLRSGL